MRTMEVNLRKGLLEVIADLFGKATEEEISSLNLEDLNLEDAIKATPGMTGEQIDALTRNTKIDGLVKDIQTHEIEKRPKKLKKEITHKVSRNTVEQREEIKEEPEEFRREGR